MKYLKTYETLSVNDIRYSLTDHFKDIISNYISWKFDLEIDNCEFIGFFVSKDGRLGMEFWRDSNKDFNFIKDEEEFNEYLNDPELFMNTKKYNI